jgi:hypothetical protein
MVVNKVAADKVAMGKVMGDKATAGKVAADKVMAAINRRYLSDRVPH